MNHAELRKTYLPGQQWEFRYLPDNQGWTDVYPPYEPAWVGDFEYRLKPPASSKPLERYSIWQTVEMDAASRDFDYENYARMHAGSGTEGAILEPSVYALVHKILDEAMLLDIAEDAPLEPLGYLL